MMYLSYALCFSTGLITATYLISIDRTGFAIIILLMISAIGFKTTKMKD